MDVAGCACSSADRVTFRFFVDFAGDVSKTLNDVEHLLGKLTSELYASQRCLALLHAQQAHKM